jgi:hypothetical protein
MELFLRLGNGYWLPAVTTTLGVALIVMKLWASRTNWR